jgi:uncharacterized membrane protein (DUF2068 family)
VTTAGERAIATYKTLKGALQLVVAGALAIVIVTGHDATVGDVVTELAHHASRAWSIALAHAVARGVTRRGLQLTAFALAADGVLTSFEGWALRRGHAWGRWMVVIATGSLLPFELFAFARGRHWMELAAFALNFTIVAYLAHRATGRRPPARGGGMIR